MMKNISQPSDVRLPEKNNDILLKINLPDEDPKHTAAELELLKKMNLSGGEFKRRVQDLAARKSGNCISIKKRNPDKGYRLLHLKHLRGASDDR
ncbi:MAG: hypothetical protein U9P90_03830 [Patescibacteria group bacterium]|nr:hypothetical protein [Patescibacteria group bacterium]